MSPPKKSLMRSLGEFFGHIAHGFRTDVGKDRRVLRHEVEEKTEDTPGGRGTVTLRRTTIEEVEVDRPRNER